jgi:hypothetical protein
MRRRKTWGMTRGGRPLRFLGTTLGGWIGLRAVMLWPTAAHPPALTGLFAPPAAAAGRHGIPFANPAPPPHNGSDRGPTAVPRRRLPAALARAGTSQPGAEQTSIAVAAAAPPADSPKPIGAGVIPPPLAPTPLPAQPKDRLSASVWAIARQGLAPGLPGDVAGGQLGASQIGARVVRAIDRRGRIAATGRVSTPLVGPGAEAALGIELRLPHLPVRAIAERRFVIDRARGGGGAALYLVGGIAPTPVGAGLRLEGYGQAGAVARARVDTFADGALRLTRRFTATLDLGIGAWGGAQPGAARLDVGPTLGIAIPVARQRVRLSIDWRQRVGGRANPASGPALSIGSDF